MEVAERADDPVVKAVVRRIAADEGRNARCTGSSRAVSGRPPGLSYPPLGGRESRRSPRAQPERTVARLEPVLVAAEPGK